MKSMDELELKAELEEIMRRVDAVMQKVEQVVPTQNQPSEPKEVNP